MSGVDADEGASFDDPEENARTLMGDAHSKFMQQGAPQDASKQNVLNRNHTHVGIGVHITKTAFRYVEVFLDRYVELHEVSS